MNIKVGFAIFFCSIAFTVTAQSELFVDAFRNFSTSRLWEYEPIPVNWNMEGMLQADLNDGLNSLMEGEPAQAEASFTTVLKKDSSIWQAYYYRAASRKKQEKLLEAQRDIQRALKLNDFYEGYIELAKIYHLRAQLTESERAINKAIRLDKQRATAYFIKGNLKVDQKEYKAAITLYKDCLVTDSLFHDARLKLGLLEAVEQKDEALIIPHLNKVLKYDSLQKTALLFRAILFIEKDKNQSVQDLSKLILVDPQNLMAYFVRGVLYTDLENFSPAFSDFQRVIKATATSENNFAGQQTWLDKKIDIQNAGAYTITRIYGLPDDDAKKLKQAYCLIVTGKYERSITIINETTKPNEEPLCVYLKAVAYEHSGQHPKAFKFYNIALELDDEITDAYKKRAIYEQEMERWKESVADFSAAIRLNPETFVFYKLRGVSNFYAKDYPAAISDYTVYLKYDTANREIMGYRGMAYLKDNKRLHAYMDFVASDNKQMLDFEDADNLIDSVLVAGDTSFVITCLNTITKHAPFFTEGFVRKFEIHEIKNEWGPIEADIYRAIEYIRSDIKNAQRSYLFTMQAMVLERTKKNEEALKHFDEAIKVDKKNARAYLERGKLYLGMGKSTKAESDFKQASSLGNEQAKELLSSNAQQ